MVRQVAAPLGAAVLLGAVLRDNRTYVGGIRIVLEVRTAQGDLRSFQRPGSPGLS